MSDTLSSTGDASRSAAADIPARDSNGLFIKLIEELKTREDFRNDPNNSLASLAEELARNIFSVQGACSACILRTLSAGDKSIIPPARNVLGFNFPARESLRNLGEMSEILPEDISAHDDLIRLTEMIRDLLKVEPLPGETDKVQSVLKAKHSDPQAYRDFIRKMLERAVATCRRDDCILKTCIVPAAST